MDGHGKTLGHRLKTIGYMTEGLLLSAVMPDLIPHPMNTFKSN